jgi:hypothetical protein
MVKALVDYEHRRLTLRMVSEIFGSYEVVVEDLGYFLPMVDFAPEASPDGLPVRSVKIPESLPPLLPAVNPAYFVHCLLVPKGRGYLAFAAKRARYVAYDA